MTTNTLLHFIFCKISSLVSNGAVKNSLVVIEAFCEPTDGSFGRSIADGEGKSIVSVYSSKNKTLLFP